MTNDLILEQSRTSYIDLPAITGGTLLALAISIILANFGSMIGLAMTDDFNLEIENAWAAVIAAGLWILWVQVLASMAGGYLAGRMRRPISNARDHEREIRDGAHGLLVWAAGTVAVAIGVGITTALAAFTNEPELEQATNQALIDMRHNATIIFAFITASVSLVSGVASWWAATKGGEHRDDAVDHSRYVSFRKR